MKLESGQWEAVGISVGSLESESDTARSFAGGSGVAGREGQRQEGIGDGIARNTEDDVPCSPWCSSAGD